MDRAAAEEDSPAGIPVGVGIREAEEDIPAVAGNPEAVADNRVVEVIRAAGEDNSRSAEAYRRKSYRTWRKR